MNPFIEQKFAEMQTEIDMLKDMLKQFESASQIDPLYVRAISQSITSSTSKSASSENQAVSESGAGTYNVLKPPDRFIKIGDNNVPAYD